MYSILKEEKLKDQQKCRKTDYILKCHQMAKIQFG
jgi:hypothetical protein